MTNLHSRQQSLQSTTNYKSESSALTDSHLAKKPGSGSSSGNSSNSNRFHFNATQIAHALPPPIAGTNLNPVQKPNNSPKNSIGIVNYNEQTLSSGSFNLSGAISKQSIATGRKGSEGKEVAPVSQVPKPKLDPFSKRVAFLIL